MSAEATLSGSNSETSKNDQTFILHSHLNEIRWVAFHFWLMNHCPLNSNHPRKIHSLASRTGLPTNWKPYYIYHLRQNYPGKSVYIPVTIIQYIDFTGHFKPYATIDVYRELDSSLPSYNIQYVGDEILSNVYESESESESEYF